MELGVYGLSAKAGPKRRPRTTGGLGHLDGLRKAAAEVDRPAWLGRMEINFMPLGQELDTDTARHYADVGVDRLLIYPLPLEDPADAAAYLERHAGLLT